MCFLFNSLPVTRLVLVLQQIWRWWRRQRWWGGCQEKRGRQSSSLICLLRNEQTDAFIHHLCFLQREPPLPATCRSRRSWRKGKLRDTSCCPALALKGFLLKSKSLSAASGSSSRTAMTMMKLVKQTEHPSCWPRGSKHRRRRSEADTWCSSSLNWRHLQMIFRSG